MFTQKTIRESSTAYLEKIPNEHRLDRLEASETGRFFEEYYQRDRPVILTNALSAWGCLEKWTIPYLESLLGEHRHTFSYEDEAKISMVLLDYLKLAANNGTPEQYNGLFPKLPSATETLPYVRHLGPIDQRFLDDYPIESLFPRPATYHFTSYFFCGVPTTKTNCHYDWSHNFVGIVHGQKHVTLLPPHAERHMTVPEELREKMGHGDCDFFEDPGALVLKPTEGGVMMHEHPVFKTCPEVYYSPLFAGDLVFFPSYWYHYFHNVESSISVTTQSSPR